MIRSKILLLILFIAAYSAGGQNLKFAWLTDIHVGYAKSDSVILKQIDRINSQNDVGFVVITGDISETGKWEELERAQKLLSKLNKRFLIIPGNHDTKWSDMGGMEFPAIFGDNKFRLI